MSDDSRESRRERRGAAATVGRAGVGQGGEVHLVASVNAKEGEGRGRGGADCLLLWLKTAATPRGWWKEEKVGRWVRGGEGTTRRLQRMAYQQVAERSHVPGQMSERVCVRVKESVWYLRAAPGSLRQGRCVKYLRVRYLGKSDQVRPGHAQQWSPPGTAPGKCLKVSTGLIHGSQRREVSYCPD